MISYKEAAELAEAAIIRKNWQEAIQLWKNIRAEYPARAQAYSQAAFALRQSGDTDGAEALAQKAMELFPKDPRGYFQYAEVAMCRKDWAEAVRRWEMIRKFFPHHPGGYIREGAALRLDYKFSDAEQLLLKSTELFPDIAQAFIEYAEVAMRQSNWEEASRRWNMVRSKFPQKPLGYIRGSVALREYGKLLEAEKLIKQALEHFPNEPAVVTEYCEISMQRKDWSEAVSRWQLMQNRFPDNKNVYIRGAIALREKKDYEQSNALLIQGKKRIPNHPWAIFDNINIQITLRCNMNCLNCIKFCNMENITGLDYSNTDMNLGQIKSFIDNVKQHKNENLKVIESVSITGGEPLLNPSVVDIVNTIEYELVRTGLVGKVYINSNLTIDPHPEIEQFIVNFSKPEHNALIHNIVLLHPFDFISQSPTFKTCSHYRKWRIVLNCYGYSLCCAGDAYIRLFNLEDLIIDNLPGSYDGFPLNKMDAVCQHCPFWADSPPLQKNLGRPVSQDYAEQAAINKTGRRIMKRFREIQ